MTKYNLRSMNNNNNLPSKKIILKFKRSQTNPCHISSLQVHLNIIDNIITKMKHQLCIQQHTLRKILAEVDAEDIEAYFSDGVPEYYPAYMRSVSFWKSQFSIQNTH